MEALIALLENCTIAHIATHGSGGPHTTPVFYAPFGSRGDLVWCSDPGVLHSTHLSESSEMAVSIVPPGATTLRVRGIQMRGTGTSPEELQDVLRTCYLRRYPSARTYVLARPHSRFYCFTRTWARVIQMDAGIRRNLEWGMIAAQT